MERYNFFNGNRLTGFQDERERTYIVLRDIYISVKILYRLRVCPGGQGLDAF